LFGRRLSEWPTVRRLGSYHRPERMNNFALFLHKIDPKPIRRTETHAFVGDKVSEHFVEYSSSKL